MLRVSRFLLEWKLRAFASRVKRLGIVRKEWNVFEVEPFEITHKRITFGDSNRESFSEDLDELQFSFSELNAPDLLDYRVELFASVLNVPYYKIDDKCDPIRFRDTDSGFDLVSREDCEIRPRRHAVVPCGIILILPNFLEAQIRGRSGFAKRGILTHFGTIDSEYRGELGPVLFNFTNEAFRIKRGDRVCQVVIVPKVSLPNVIRKYNLASVSSFKPTSRGRNGFGSTGV